MYITGKAYDQPRHDAVRADAALVAIPPAHPLPRRLGPPPHEVVGRQVSTVFAVGPDLLRTVGDSSLVAPKALD